MSDNICVVSDNICIVLYVRKSSHVHHGVISDSRNSDYAHLQPSMYNPSNQGPFIQIYMDAAYLLGLRVCKIDLNTEGTRRPLGIIIPRLLVYLVLCVVGITLR